MKFMEILSNRETLRGVHRRFSFCTQIFSLLMNEYESQSKASHEVNARSYAVVIMKNRSYQMVYMTTKQSFPQTNLTSIIFQFERTLYQEFLIVFHKRRLHQRSSHSDSGRQRLNRQYEQSSCAFAKMQRLVAKVEHGQLLRLRHWRPESL